MGFRDVQLELVRPGPPHNQLLSPLTQYLALCGESSPITLRVDFEHRRLLSRLERLRYVSPDASGEPVRVSTTTRERELTELGEDMGEFFGSIPSLAAEIANARVDAPSGNGEQAEILHLRIVLSGSELSVLPYEISIAPQAMPGEGIPTVLQGRVPIVATREVRRSRPLPTRLDEIDAVRVLFVVADPAGLGVPTEQHTAQLYRAVEPWVRLRHDLESGDPPTAAERATEIRRHLRVLTDASLADIYDACASEQFTHVHVLAHGAHYRLAGEERYGIGLRDPKTGGLDVVGGQRLAHALGAEAADGNSRAAPFWVTLATCDSGNQGSVLVPGGSIAHELHASGIPWVLASQFPLTKQGSVDVAGFLYPRLFRGDDPRQVLYELRRYLYSHARDNHDWASLVAYASTPPDFDHQVGTFMKNATRSAIERQMAVAHGIAKGGAPAGERLVAIREALEPVHDLLDRWEQRLPTGTTMRDRLNRTNFYGLTGSIRKQMALLTSGGTTRSAEAQQQLLLALEAYRRGKDEWATDGPDYGWTASQYLALNRLVLGQDDPPVRLMCLSIMERDLQSDDPSTRAWAHATVAEIELLMLGDGDVSVDREAVIDRVRDNCRSIVELMGRDSFHVESTRRQFQRYLEGFAPLAKEGVLEQLREGARAAVQVLDGA